MAKRVDEAVDEASGLGEPAVAGEHARTGADLATWALEMYGQPPRAVELHPSALQRLVPPAGAAAIRQGSQS